MIDRYLVLWSGGLDSTTMIKHLLDQGHIVDAIYIEFKNNEHKTIRELKAIESLRNIFFDRNPRFKFLGTAISTDFLIADGNIDFKQAPVFIAGIMCTISTEKYDHVAIGYVAGDQIISWLDDLTTIYNSYHGMFSRQTSVLPNLVFPLKKWLKEDNVSFLGDMIPYVTWCENPNESDNCGVCTPCKRMADFRLRDKKDEDHDEFEVKYNEGLYNNCTCERIL
jgi:7-cyano-7-deazaguanine synthase in queuosine biosynthesis